MRMRLARAGEGTGRAQYGRATRGVLAAGRVGKPYNGAAKADRRTVVVVQTICRLLDARAPLADGRAHESLIPHVKDRPGHDRALPGFRRDAHSIPFPL